MLIFNIIIMFLLKNQFYVLKFENMCEKLYTISLKVSLSFKHVTAGLMYIEIPQFNNFLMTNIMWRLDMITIIVFCFLSYKMPRLRSLVWGQSVKSTRTRSVSSRSRWALSMSNTNICLTGPKWWVSGKISKLFFFSFCCVCHYSFCASPTLNHSLWYKASAHFQPVQPNLAELLCAVWYIETTLWT